MQDAIAQLLRPDLLVGGAIPDLDRYGATVSAILATALLIAFLRQILFEPVRESGGSSDLGMLRDPRPPDSPPRR